jgi:thioredoxin reductase (NADPH)
MSDPSLTDLTIIGAGPVGLFAAYYAGLRHMSVQLVDSLDILGGQLAALYPEKDIYDVPGYPRVLAKDLIAQLTQQGLQYQPGIHLGEQVLDMTFHEINNTYALRTSRTDLETRTILIAAGLGAFKPKTLPLPNAADYQGRGLHYSVQKPADFSGQRILIVGGGDSAVDWANALAPVANVTLIHRRDVFRAHEDSVGKMKLGPARLLLFHELKALGGNGQVEHATIYDNRSKQHQTIEVDAVLVNIGFDSALGPIAHWDLELEGGQIKVDGMMQTNRPGVYAAGDICTYPGKLKLIVTGFSEAAIAANYAKHYIDPAANIFPGHSSSLKK